MKTSTAAAVPERSPLPSVAPDVGLVEGPEGRHVLAEIADIADARDRLAGRLVVALAQAKDDDLAVTATRLSLQVWVEQVCRITAADAKRLLGDVDVLAGMPGVLGGLRDGRLSWSQVTAVCAAARTVAVGRRGELDTIIGSMLDEYRAYGPDELVGQVWQIVDGWGPSRLEQVEQAVIEDEFLAFRPQLEGGGSFYGQYGPEHFAILCEAVDAPIGPPVSRPDPDDPDAVDAAFEELDDRRRRLARLHGRTAARRLIELCEASLAGTTRDGERIAPRPTAYVVTTLDGLADRDRTPGWLLHTLTGGRMRATTTLINTMIDRRGADVRLLVFDDHGTAIGVGKKTNVPPGWLRDTIHVQHLVDQAPGGTTPIRRADLDHIVPWPAGPTDVTNLQPLGRTAHIAKTKNQADVNRTRDGTTVWTDRRTGLTVQRPPPWRAGPRPP